jgi:hypothetical protein
MTGEAVMAAVVGAITFGLMGWAVWALFFR